MTRRRDVLRLNVAKHLTDDASRCVFTSSIRKTAFDAINSHFASCLAELKRAGSAGLAGPRVHGGECLAFIIAGDFVRNGLRSNSTAAKCRKTQPFK